jgi:excisionase family DNA binding protein
MSFLAHRQLTSSPRDAELARESIRLISRHRPLLLQVRDDEHEEPVELPAGAVAVLLNVLEAIAAGRGLAIIPENVELTTAEAAAILNVSRPFLIKLLEAGEIPHRKVGKHRRVLMEEILAFKARDDRSREAVLDQLSDDAQEQDMGYPKP